jgi:hypothetical protein
MPSASGFLTGILEGFYGRVWSHETRLAYADYLEQAGLNTCLYCPKADPWLRKQWQSDWPAARWRELLEQSAAYRRRGIHWGVGLSPFALYQQYGRSQREQLRRKVARLAELDAPLLAILFDDMPGEIDDLASRQAEIVADVVAWVPGVGYWYAPRIILSTLCWRSILVGCPLVTGRSSGVSFLPASISSGPVTGSAPRQYPGRISRQSVNSCSAR